jgi:hypothetical protein
VNAASVQLFGAALDASDFARVTGRVEKPRVAKSRHAEIKGVNVMSPALPDVEGFS